MKNVSSGAGRRRELCGIVICGLLMQPFVVSAETRTLKPGERWDFCQDVKAEERYSLSFTARNEGPDTLGNNAQIAEAFYDKRRVEHGLWMPGWELSFTDADGKGVSASLSSFHRVVLSGKDEAFRDVFFAPRRATRVRIRFANPTKDARFVVAEPTLAPYAEKTVNINADFALGEHCFSGFSPVSSGTPRLRKTSRGIVLEVESYTFIDTTPVVGGRTYRLEAELEKKVPRNPKINLSFQDENGKGIADCGGLVWVTEADKPTVRDFPAPPKAVTVGAMINGAPGVAFKYIRLTEVRK